MLPQIVVLHMNLCQFVFEKCYNHSDTILKFPFKFQAVKNEKNLFKHSYNLGYDKLATLWLHF